MRILLIICIAFFSFIKENRAQEKKITKDSVVLSNSSTIKNEKNKKNEPIKNTNDDTPKLSFGESKSNEAKSREETPAKLDLMEKKDDN